MNIFEDFQARVGAALKSLAAAGRAPAGLDLSRFVVEPPREAAHGDLSTNAAMVYAREAKAAGGNPRALAEALAEVLRKTPDVEAVEVAGPGFINIRLALATYARVLVAILDRGLDFGRAAKPVEGKVNVEYVSANPTGPMHVGHARGAVFGDALANLLVFAGREVTREYYVNDAGAQVDVLARSALLRYREALGEAVTIPEGFYPGDYLKPLGAALAAEFGASLRDKPEAEWLAPVRARAIAAMMAMIKDDLAALNIVHEVFSSERALTGADGGEDQVRAAIEDLRGRGIVYVGRLPPPKGQPSEDWEDREQTLFRSTDFGDDVDRPLIKSDGGYTYFASDIAYHKSKIDRGFLTSDRRLGGRSRRLRQTHAGGGRRAVGRQGHSRRAAVPTRPPDARRRAGEDVETLRRIRHVARSRRRGRRRSGAVHHVDAQERRAARLRPRQGDRAEPRQSGLLCAICARPRPQRPTPGARGLSRHRSRA